MFGLININKPIGKTSRDVVNEVQRLVRPAKAGHAGTLDPLARGVLVVCVGPATRLIQYVQRMPKRYLATFRFGCRSLSDDIELEVTRIDAPQPSRAAIEAALPSFVGTILQRPPAFSAIKVKGKRAYDLARDGKQLQLEARPISIHGIDLVSYDYPELVLDIRCGSGTYIRSIGRDLAEQLGTAAVMSALARTEIGPFSMDGSTELQQLSGDSMAQRLRPASDAVDHLPALLLDDDQLKMLSNGIMLPAPDPPRESETAAFDKTGQLIAILAPHTGNRLRPVVNFAPLLATAGGSRSQ